MLLPKTRLHNAIWHGESVDKARQRLRNQAQGLVVGEGCRRFLHLMLRLSRI